jgi:hypothetical protein
MNGVSVRRIPSGLPAAGIAVARIHVDADPTMDDLRREALRAKYTSEARYRREIQIEYEALEGELLYPEFSRTLNLCDPFDVSDRDYWTLYMALDPHPRTAHAMAWEAFNKHDDRIVCGEFWPEFGTVYASDGGRWRTKDYAAAIQLFESDSQYKPAPFEWANGKRLVVRRRFMDTFGKAANSDEGDGEDYFESYRRLGIELTKKAIVDSKGSEQVNLHFDPALKGHDNLAKAQDSIARALAPSKQGPPRMRCFNNLYELIDEFENVRFPKGTRRPGDDFGLEGTAGREMDERPITFQRHVVDCLHYIETARPGFLAPDRRIRSVEPLYPDSSY